MRQSLEYGTPEPAVADTSLRPVKLKVNKRPTHNSRDIAFFII
jgi:hypothetical protein